MVKTAKTSGIDVDILDTLRCHVEIKEGRSEIFYKGVPLEAYDAIVPRIGCSATNYGLPIVRQFELSGAFCLNSAAAIGAARDKVQAAQLLTKSNIAMPPMAFAHASTDIKKIDCADGRSAIAAAIS